MAGKSALFRGGYARISAYSKPSIERWLRSDAIIFFMDINRVDTICSSGFGFCGVGAHCQRESEESVTNEKPEWSLSRPMLARPGPSWHECGG